VGFWLLSYGIILAIYLVIASWRQKGPVARRLAQLRGRDEGPAEEARPALTLSLRPALRRVGEFLEGLGLSGRKERLARLIWQAGRPHNLRPADITALQLVLVVAGIAAGGILALAPSTRLLGLQLAVLGAVTGYRLPIGYLESRARARRAALERALPEILDLLTVSVQAGLGFDAAVAKVTAKLQGPAAEDFGFLLRDIRVRGRMEALRRWGERSGVPDIKTFVAALVQADRLGVSVSRVLAVQSSAMRTKRRQRAEERAMQAPVKLLFPLIFFIFPTIFVVLLGPAALHLIEVLGGM